MGLLTAVAGALAFGVGGMLILFSSSLVLSAVLNSFGSAGGIVNGLAFGFTGFVLVGVGLFYLIVEAVQTKSMEKKLDEN